MFENPQKEDKFRNTLANAIDKLVDKFENITEYNSYELKSLSLLQTDKYLRKMLTFFIDNKKHLNRKYANEIIELAKTFSESGRSNELDEKDGFFSRLFNKDSR